MNYAPPQNVQNAAPLSNTTLRRDIILLLTPLTGRKPSMANCSLESEGYVDGDLVHSLHKKYNSKGQLIEEVFSFFDDDETRRYETKREYNFEGRIQRREEYRDSELLEKTLFQYDAAGHIQKIVKKDFKIAVSEELLFTQFGVPDKRLIYHQDKKFAVQFYNYDFINREVTISEVDAKNCLKDTTRIHFNDDGRLVSRKVISYREMGGTDTVEDARFEYGFDEDRLIYKTRYDKNKLFDVTTYEYDEAGKIKKMRIYDREISTYRFKRECAPIVDAQAGPEKPL